MKPIPEQPSLLADAALPPEQENGDRAAVFDALAFSQAPTTAHQLVELIASAGLRTRRGSAFHANEVRRLLDELAAQGLASRDDRGRWTAQRDVGWLRFRALVAEPACASVLVGGLVPAVRLRLADRPSATSRWSARCAW